MKPLLFICAWFLTTGHLSAQPVTVPALGPRYKQTRERAEILFGHRNGTYPVPEARSPLFQTTSEPTGAPRAKIPDAGKVEDSDEARLNEALAALKKGGGGIVTIAGRTVLTIAQKSYKEGDAIGVPLGGRIVVVRITRIAGNSVTLTLNGNETIWRFSTR